MSGVPRTPPTKGINQAPPTKGINTTPHTSGKNTTTRSERRRKAKNAKKTKKALEEEAVKKTKKTPNGANAPRVPKPPATTEPPKQKSLETTTEPKTKTNNVASSAEKTTPKHNEPAAKVSINTETVVKSVVNSDGVAKIIRGLPEGAELNRIPEIRAEEGLPPNLPPKTTITGATSNETTTNLPTKTKTIQDATSSESSTNLPTKEIKGATSNETSTDTPVDTKPKPKTQKELNNLVKQQFANAQARINELYVAPEEVNISSITVAPRRTGKKTRKKMLKQMREKKKLERDIRKLEEAASAEPSFLSKVWTLGLGMSRGQENHSGTQTKIDLLKAKITQLNSNINTKKEKITRKQSRAEEEAYSKTENKYKLAERKALNKAFNNAQKLREKYQQYLDIEIQEQKEKEKKRENRKEKKKTKTNILANQDNKRAENLGDYMRNLFNNSAATTKQPASEEPKPSVALNSTNGTSSSV